MNWIIPRPVRDLVNTYQYFNAIKTVNNKGNEVAKMTVGMLYGITAIPRSEHLIKVSLRTGGAALLAIGVYSDLISENVGGALTFLASPSIALLYFSSKAAKIGVEYLLTGNANSSLTEAGIGLICLAGSYVAAEVHDLRRWPQIEDKFPGEIVIKTISEKAAPSVCQFMIK